MFIVDYLAEYNRYLNLVGIAVILGIAYAFSRKRTHINFKLVGCALLLQCATAFFVLKTAVGQWAVQGIANSVSKIYQFAGEGIAFMFGNLANVDTSWGFIFAVQILPIIIFFGALTAVLSHFGIVQCVVNGVSYVMRPLLGTTGAETLCAIANSFLGQTEAPLLIRNYLKNMTKSEMFVVMVSGMATISGSILVVYASMGVPVTHLLVSSVMAVPASILIAKILYPETEKTKTDKEDVQVTRERSSSNVFDAVFTGTSDGLQLAINVGAMLIAFLSLIAMLNYMLGYGASTINYLLFQVGIAPLLPELNLNMIFSYFFAPFAYLFGFSGAEALTAGKLLGIKVGINEMVAFKELIKSGLSERATNIMTYALCGFSNFSCIGIQVGGIGALVPEKRAWLTELGLMAVLGGALSNILSAMVVSLLV
jgi:CNT family concentrative nucleoside transporter